MKEIVLAIMVALFIDPVWGQVVDNDYYIPDDSLVYKSAEQGDLKLYLFYPQSGKRDSRRTVVVHFFGGGWVSGNPTQFYQQSRYYNEHGMVAISAEYRVAQRHGTSPFECVEDAKSAIRWVRENAKQLGINPDKIVASGGSAGGHIAACTALIEGYDNDSEGVEVSSVPNALVLFNPVLDTTEKGYGAEKLVGQQTLISPQHHVREGLPPTLVLHGDDDKTVPYANAVDFVEAMQGAGNESELVTFEGVGHGFFNGSFFRPRNGDDNFNRCMDSSVCFILKYLK